MPNLGKGGAERFVVDLCNELAGSGDFEVHLVSLGDNDVSSSFVTELEESVIYHSLGKKKGFDIATLFNTIRLLRKLNPWVVNTHINAQEYAIGYKLLSGKAVKYFHTLHSDAFMECDQPKVRKWRKWLYQRSVVIPVTISKASSSSFNACYGLSNDYLIENGRSPSRVNNVRPGREDLFPVDTKGAFIVLNVARITTAKNQQLLVEAVNRFNNNAGKKCFLFIIGPVLDEEVYKALLQKQSPYIHFLGPRRNITDYLRSADAFALSSVYEGMPISLIEAFEAGCVPVSTPVGGIVDMIEDGKNGFLSKDLDVQSFLHALERCLFAPDKENIRRICMDNFNTRYHIAITAKKYLELYERQE